MVLLPNKEYDVKDLADHDFLISPLQADPVKQPKEKWTKMREKLETFKQNH